MTFAIIAGAGPGLGQALLDRFQAGGYRAVGLSRSAAASGPHESQELDLGDRAQVQAVIAGLIDRHGVPQVVIHNAARLLISPFAETSHIEFEECWRSGVLSAFNLAQAVLPAMAETAGSAFLVSGATASQRGGAGFAAFASAKFALRGLTQSLARTYQPLGVHVAHFNLDGIIDTPASRELHQLPADRMMHPADIAEVYWQIAHQPASTWSHEVDLRPPSEAF